MVKRVLQTPKIAHFLLTPELSGSPPNDALKSAYRDLGYAVDLYAPWASLKVQTDDPDVSEHHVDYSRRWLFNNLWRPKWRRYRGFSGTSEDPIAIVGLLSALHRRPAIVLADEIKSGNYRGDRSEYWKKLCRFGMRQAKLTIVNDAARVELQRQYADLPQDYNVAIYPGGFREPPERVNWREQRKKWGIPENAIVAGSSGGFNLTAGADWLVQALEAIPDLHAVIQPLGVDPLSSFLLGHLASRQRVYVEQERLDWRRAWAQAGAMDIGIVVYKNPAAQFQLMGTSSNRLCMFLAMGVPVVASRQDSFKFLEKYDCGILVDDSAGFSAAIDKIRSRLSDMKANAVQCWREYVATSRRYDQLVAAVRDALECRSS